MLTFRSTNCGITLLNTNSDATTPANADCTTLLMACITSNLLRESKLLLSAFIVKKSNTDITIVISRKQSTALLTFAHSFMTLFLAVA